MNAEEAKKIALKSRPGMTIQSISELENCFVVNLVPENYKEEYGLFIGGATRVDKKTGKTSLYNPMLEVNNA